MNASITTHICDDVVVNILCRLPEKALIQCKCICKAWDRLINEICIPRYSINPAAMCIMFLERTASWALFPMGPNMEEMTWLKYVVLERTPSWALLTREPGSDERVCLNYIDMSEKDPYNFIFNIQCFPFYHSLDCLLDSCNGLLLFYSPSNYQYYVCNPTTKEFMFLPDECKYVDCLSAVLAFDPWKLVHFKAVCFFYSSKNTQLRIEVYSSESSEWDIYTIPLPSHPQVGMWLAPFVWFNGKVYINSSSGKVLCLDITLMSISQILLPEYEEGKSVSLLYEFGVLGKSTERLCYTTTTTDNALIKVWFFDDDRYGGSKWILKLNICIMGIKNMISLEAHCPLVKVVPFGLGPSCDVVYFGTGSVVLSYEFKSSHCKRVASMTSKGLRFTHPMVSHVCCLVSLNSISRSSQNPNQIIENYYMANIHSEERIANYYMA